MLKNLKGFLNQLTPEKLKKMNENNKPEIKTGQIIPAVLYGMQRASTNYTEQLIVKNFKDVKILNSSLARCLPAHRHFRLYDQKFIIPDQQYYNSFTYDDFPSFKAHVNEISEQEVRFFIVTIKDPFSWYLSYYRHAKKNGFPMNRKTFNSHFVIDYNLFYRKWLAFKKQAPAEVLIVKYEDALNDLSLFLKNIAVFFGMDSTPGHIINPKKVGMSKKFSSKKLEYYSQKKYMDMLSSRDKKIIISLIDEEILSLYDYNRDF